MKLTFDGSEWESAVVAKDGTLSAEVDLGANYKYVTVLIPTIDSATVSVQGLKASGGTAYPIHDWETLTERFYRLPQQGQVVLRLRLNVASSL